ncbi:hypothetical protein Agabi119p4_7320 [Agaricus bisporus var. burnettii]|uniref:Uncharacterized protein n=1 Tax=Agaricus bisporus var. burnettii TaxID=192524 RepID=A0A8H7C7E3_AGABI|nr:hypothetical protein Agabi119p4_7320 [Agaricus bisporus var. burnettii]
MALNHSITEESCRIAIAAIFIHGDRPSGNHFESNEGTNMLRLAFLSPACSCHHHDVGNDKLWLNLALHVYICMGWEPLGRKTIRLPGTSKSYTHLVIGHVFLLNLGTSWDPVRLSGPRRTEQNDS